MSKFKVNTRQKILDKALKTFNERGIEYVGMRELASILDMHVGNITYYFPTKDDLVYALSIELSQKNDQVITTRHSISMKEFLQVLAQVFNHHIEYRCLFLSIVHIMQQNKQIASAYKKTQAQRQSTIKANIILLSNSGYLKVSDEERDFLTSNLSLISRFWISEAAISFNNMKPEQVIRHYLKLVITLFQPYSTARAKKEAQLFLDELEPAAL